jgi:hypothetical protein
MRHSPRTLYTFASALWAETREQDEISALYETAEEKITRDSGAPVPVRQERWMLRLHTYEEFWSDHGRSARENTRDRRSLPSEERRLGEWARYQRRFEPELSTYQRLRLDVSPAFDWDPQEASWQRSMTACLAFVARTGSLPKLDSTDRDQFTVARWLARQLRLVQSGMISNSRAAAIRSLLAEAQRQR